jgi:hypothetical protein
MNSGLSAMNLFQPVLRFRERYWTGRENDGQSAAPGTKALDGPVEARRESLGPREPPSWPPPRSPSFNFLQQSDQNLFQADRPVEGSPPNFLRRTNGALPVD